MVSYADCSYKQLKKAAEKLGFVNFEGKRHCKIKDKDDNFITIIPRHNKIKKETAKGIVSDFQKRGNASLEEIERGL